MSWIWQGRQLTKAVKDKTVTFTYDSEGIRTSKSDGTNTTKYLLNGTQILAQTTNGKTLCFFYDQQGNRVGMADGKNNFYYYIYNVQGDVIALADASTGKLAVTYTYDAWGKLVKLEDSTANSVGTQNPFRYRGYYYDTETSLYYLQSRYYDPEVGRFINADAFTSTDISGALSTNMFAYCENNPVAREDPSGELSDIIIGGLIGMASNMISSAVAGNDFNAVLASGVVGFATGAIQNSKAKIVVNAIISAYNGVKTGIKCKSVGAGIGTFAISFGASFVSGDMLSNSLEDSLSKAAINVFDATFGLGANLCATNVTAHTERQSVVKNKKASKHDYVIGCDYEKTKFCLCSKATFDVGILFRLRRSGVPCDVSLCF